MNDGLEGMFMDGEYPPRTTPPMRQLQGIYNNQWGEQIQERDDIKTLMDAFKRHYPHMDLNDAFRRAMKLLYDKQINDYQFGTELRKSQKPLRM